MAGLERAVRCRLGWDDERVPFLLGELQPCGRDLASGTGDHLAAERVGSNDVDRCHELGRWLVFEHLDRRPPAVAQAFE